MTSSSVVEVRLLGPVGMYAAGRPVGLGPRKQRLALAVLALEVNQLVTVDRLVELMWAESPPRTAVHAVRVCVSRLRTVLASALHGVPADRRGETQLVGSGGGYLLRADPEAIDAHRFRALTDQARAADSDHERLRLLDQALELWTGPALAGSAPVELSERLCRGLSESRLAAIEERFAAQLRLGRHDEVLAELTGLVEAHPLRERPVELLMLALFRAGRAADALHACRLARQRLADELGLDPGPELQRLELAILRGDPSLAPATVTVHSPPVERPALLPPAVSGFVGRGQELAALDGALAEHDPDGTAASIVVISGTAGVGKTSLAVSWAHSVAKRFPDGQLYANLRGFDPSGAPMSPAEAVRGFLDALGVPAERIPASSSALTDLYRSRLAGTRTLVLLDNAAGVEQVRPLLPGAPGSLVLVTSRDRLTSLVAVEGARPVTLDVLHTGEARQLLARRLGPARAEAERDAVNDLVESSARLPLALAIVAARAATRPNVPLAEVAAEVRAAGAALDPFHAGDAATDLRALFSWSYRTLSTGAARLFRLLGPHPGPDVGLAAMSSLAGLPAAETTGLVAELTAAHLLAERGGGRFAFHDLLRAYATELAHTVDADGERRAAHRRLFDHYLHTAQRAAELLDTCRDSLPLGQPADGARPQPLPGHPEALRWLIAEHAVLVAAVEQAAATGFDGHAWRLATVLAEYFERRGHWHDWAATHTTARSAAERLGDLHGLAHSQRGLGRAYLWLGRYDEAQEHYETALDLFAALGDPLGQARTWHSLGRVAELRGHYQEALAHTQRGLALFQASGDRAGLAKALNGVGWYHTLLGDQRQAIEHCRKALAIVRELGDHRVEANTWDSLGYVHHQTGDHGAAIVCYQRALALFRAIGDRFHEADASDHLGDTYRAAADPHRAAQSWRRAAEILEELGHADAARVRAKLAEPTMSGR
jgi:DNA-binding SARP family transcriptional activator/tetratricopeptide (TPR) repeat protein